MAIGCSFLINGQPRRWIKPCRGIRWGDLISPYMFILVSQNLTAIMIHGVNLSIMPSFDSRLNENFNHLLFANDFIVVTRASTAAARNCHLALSI